MRAALLSARQIVLVEDELDVADLLIFLLKLEGYDVTYAANGALALEQLAEATPDLILTDIMMPVMDGAKLLEALRKSERLRSIPTLVISALPEGTARRLCKGLDGFLQKPFHADQLISTVGDLLSRGRSASATPGTAP